MARSDLVPLLVTPKQADELGSLLRALRNISGGPGIAVRMVPGVGITISALTRPGRGAPTKRKIRCRLVSVTAQGVYTVQPVEPLLTEGVLGWQDIAGSETFEAQEANNWKFMPDGFANDIVVEVEKGSDVNGEEVNIFWMPMLPITTPHHGLFLFDGATQDTVRSDYVRIHA